jgi:hypothetical protein
VRPGRFCDRPTRPRFSAVFCGPRAELVPKGPRADVELVPNRSKYTPSIECRILIWILRKQDGIAWYGLD